MSGVPHTTEVQKSSLTNDVSFVIGQFMKTYKITIWSFTNPSLKKEIIVEAENTVHACQYASAALSMGERATFEEYHGSQEVSKP
jgi:hypothetical protein